MLQGRGFDKVNSIGDLLKGWNVMLKRGDSYDVTKGLFEEHAFNEIKLKEKLVKRRNNLNGFSFTHNHYKKAKFLV